MQHPRTTLTAMALGLTLATASAAAAHPSFNPNRVEAGTEYSVSLVVPHGCTASGGAPAEGEETSPTTELALQLSDDFVSFEAQDVAGWAVTRDDAAVRWVSTGGATTAPILFPVTFEVSAAADGQSLHLAANQTCEVGSTLWADTDSADGNPAVLLLVGDAVDDSDHGDHETMADDHEAHASASPSEHADHATDPEHADHASESEHAMDDEHATDSEHAMDAESAAATTGDNGFTGLAILVTLMVIGGITTILRLPSAGKE